MQMERFGKPSTFDAEHDILFYTGDEGASYSFTPEEGCIVSVARSKVSDKMSFDGFTTDKITTDNDGKVTISGLTTGRHIIKVDKDGKATYQVVTARGVSYKILDTNGKELTSDAYELKDGDAVDGIAYVIESYGLITNKTLLEKAGYTLDDIKSFDDLKKVADDIQARKDEIGVKGAFTSAGMDGSSDWRFKTHLANLPIYYEYKADGIDDTEAIKGTYLDQYKNVFDLYITDSTCDGSELSAKTADDSRNEFVNGDAVFYQNGSWEYAELAKTYSDDELAMIPIYFGVDDENEGLATGTENYWCVNKNASEEDVQATLDFMNWCVTSDDGVKAMCKDMGFTIPFKKNLKSDNVLVNEANKYTEDGKTPVSWNFSTMPSEEWKNGVGSALTSYAADPTDANWAKVTTAFVDGWAKEAAAAK